MNLKYIKINNYVYLFDTANQRLQLCKVTEKDSNGVHLYILETTLSHYEEATKKRDLANIFATIRDFQEYLMKNIKTTGKQINIKEILEEKLEKAKFKVEEVVYYKSPHDPSIIYKYKVISIDVIIEYYYATDSYGEENSLELCYEAGTIRSHTDITSLIGYDRITEILNSKLSYKLGDITTGEFSCWQSENKLYNSLEDYVSNIRVIDGD